MRELVNLLVGGAGNGMGYNFLKGVMREHNIDTNTGERIQVEKGMKQAEEPITENLNIFLDENQEDRFVPRVVMADLNNDVIESLLRKEKLLDSKCAFFTRCGNGNNFGKGYYTEGHEIFSDIIDMARKKAEDCDFFEGFQMFHSTIGGSGSGLGCLIVSKLREEFPDKMMASASVLPSTGDDFGSRSISSYNAVFSMHHLVENVDFVACLDNESVNNINRNKLNLEGYDFENMNHVITQAMLGYTTPIRYSGILNSSYRKLTTNLLPFPRMHFFTLSHTPYGSVDGGGPTLEWLVSDVFDSSNILLGIEPKDGAYITNSITFRGDVSNISQIGECVGKIKLAKPSQFKEWIPNNIHTSQCKTVSPDCQAKSSATDTTAVQMAFKKIGEQFVEMFRRKAFVHHFTDEGMDEMEFTEAESNMNDLVCEYWDYWGMASLDDEEEGEYEE